MSQDDTSEEVELTTGSEETLNGSEEHNSLDEAKKNQSNFKKVAKKAKLVPKLQSEIERLRAELAKRDGSSEEEEEDFDLGDEDEDADLFTDTKSEIFFLKTKDAEKYREEMAELIEENPKRKALPLADLLDLAKVRFPKSTSKQTINISSGRATSQDVSKMDLSKMTAEEIEALPPETYRLLRKKK